MDKIGPCLAEALLKLDRLGEAQHWDEFAMTGHRCRYNAMRHLKKRGWIEDAAQDERRAYLDTMSDDDPMPIVAYPCRWRLTEAGRAALVLLADKGVTQ